MFFVNVHSSRKTTCHKKKHTPGSRQHTPGSKKNIHLEVENTNLEEENTRPLKPQRSLNLRARSVYMMADLLQMILIQTHFQSELAWGVKCFNENVLL